MSRLDSSSASLGKSRGIVKKPATSVYTVLMILGTVAMAVGCLFLYLELARYS